MTDGTEAEETDDEGEGTPICPKCLAELAPAVDFCPHCRAPVTSFANTGYLESALAEGWGVGEAVVTASPSLVTVIGLWLLLGPPFVGLTIALVASVRARWTWAQALSSAAAGGLLCGVAWCLVRGTRNFLRTRRGVGVDEPEDGDSTPT